MGGIFRIIIKNIYKALINIKNTLITLRNL